MAILVSAHDAGGANQLIHRFLENTDVEFVFTGPASRIASEYKINHQQTFDFTSLSKYSRVYVGSNSTFQLSDLILDKAVKLKIATFGVLEHWVYFEKRWSPTPDIIEVQDIRAFVGALYYFRNRVRLRKNFYLDSIKRNFVDELDWQSSLLVVLQPINGGFSHETDKCFCPKILSLIRKQSFIRRIILRQHAETEASTCLLFLSEAVEAYISISDINSSLQNDIASSKFVLGLDSYALYVANKCRREVFTISRNRRSKFAPKYKYLD